MCVRAHACVCVCVCVCVRVGVGVYMLRVFVQGGIAQLVVTRCQQLFCFSFESANWIIGQ